MSLPLCVMRDPRPFPDGSTQHYCRHPQYPYRVRLLALRPGHCHTCPLRQETGSPPPPMPMPPPVPEPAAYTPGRPRPDLQAIELTLPPYQENRDRQVCFEPDGSIVYEKGEGEWEPPRPINGYIRDASNAWRFSPLWLPCSLRHASAVRLVNCGCVEIIMRCNNPACKLFADRVNYAACQTCPHRS